MPTSCKNQGQGHDNSGSFWQNGTGILKTLSDVGFPSVCYVYVLLTLVNKETAFSQ